MATVFSHGIVALALAKVVTAGRMPVRFWLASVVCAVLPDIDVIGFAFGIHYSDMLGHRGLTHSLFFALLVSLATVAVLFRDVQPYSGRWVNLFSFFFLVIMSHGILDGLTNGGLGVAFFAPFDNTRYFLPWQPIEVSPIGLDFFSRGRAWTVIFSEIEWIWIPSGLAVAVAWLLRRARPTQS